MSLDTAEKQKLIETHQVHETDTGSVEVQVAMLSKRISKLSDHLQGNIHDFASRQGLLKMIGKRKRLLSFIKDKNVQRYQELVKKILLAILSATYFGMPLDDRFGLVTGIDVFSRFAKAVVSE